MYSVTKMILENFNGDMQDNLNKFWISIYAWIHQQEIIEKYFQDKYGTPL